MGRKRERKERKKNVIVQVWDGGIGEQKGKVKEKGRGEEKPGKKR